MSAAFLPQWRDDWALFLDVDGTLLEIAATPAAVRVPWRAVRVLAALHWKSQGAVAFVSGRRIADLDRLFAPLRLPAAGVHGAERRDSAGDMLPATHDAGLAPARRLFGAWGSAHPGVFVEDKGMAIALHYRAVPELEPAARRVATDALAAVGPGFHLQQGRMLLEIKPESVGKGRAIAAFMQEPPFRGRVPVFVGDDLTDEDGFEAVNRLGGHSIAVGLGRSTCARWRLRDERVVLDWLERAAQAEGV